MSNYTLNYTGAGIDSLLEQVEDIPNSYLPLGGGSISGNLSVADTLTVGERQYGVNKVLWSGVWYMTASQVATLSEAVSAQPHGIVLVWSWYSDGEAKPNNFEYFFVPKSHTSNFNGRGMYMGVLGAFNTEHMSKYVYVSDTTITGYVANNIDVTYTGDMTRNNTSYVLRQVIGV